MTAKQGDREKYLAAGLDGYISKPVQSEELIKLVKAHRPVGVKS
jgi:CheY-like chemotaxis protein